MSKKPLDVERFVGSQYIQVADVVLVTTVDEDGTPNAAPKTQAMLVGRYNYYAFACCAGHHTYRNVRSTGEFVVNFPGVDLVERIARCAARVPEGTDEVSEAGLTALRARVVKPPLIAECGVHLECRATRVLDELGGDSLIIGEIVAASADEDRFIPRGRSDEAVARLARRPLLVYLEPGHYTAVRDARRFEMPEDFKE